MMRERSHVLLVLCVCANTLIASPIAAQARALGAPDIRRWASLLAVHDARAADTAVVDSALRSAHPQLRAFAVRVVGMNRIAARYPVLRDLLRSSPDTTLARDAAFALGLAVDSASCGSLRDAVTNSRAGVAAAWALGELGTACGSFDALMRTAAAPDVRSALLRVAGKWTPYPERSVTDAYDSATTGEERLAAVYSLGRARNSSGARFAVAASRNPDPQMREAAARLLAAPLQPSGDSVLAIARLRELLSDAAAHVRVAAVRAIATYRGTAFASLEARWLAERDRNVRVTMAQSIGPVASDTSALWRTWWESDTTHMVRRSLIASAWQENAIHALGAGLGDSLFGHADYRMRIAMIQGAAGVRVDSMAARIALLMADPDARVRAAAITGLAGVSATVRDAIDWNAIVGRARQEDEIGVRAAAIGTAARTAKATDVATALEAYDRAMRDPSDDARGAALGVVASAWRLDSLAFSDALLTSLRNLAPSTDPLLRNRVLAVTPLAHWRGERGAPSRTAAEYESIVRRIVVPSLLGHAPSLRISTSRGTVRILLDGVQTPMTADHFTRLARQGFFRDKRFHRVVPAFVAQGGDPRGDGGGGPGYAIRDELSRSPYLRGAVGVALAGPDTGGSQFFLTLAPQHHLNGHYAVFGHVTMGLSAMDALVQGDALRNISSIPE